MEILSYIGVLILIIGALGFLVAAFKESLLWGFACLFLGPVSLVFLILHWSEAKNPFLIQIVGLGIIFAAGAMGSEAGF
jgi:hypothetical protein